MPVPVHPAARPVEMADKPLLSAQFRALQPLISELSFANLYLFRQVHGYTLTTIRDSLIVFGRGYDGTPYFLPPLNGDRGEAARTLLAEGNTLYGADEQFVAGHLTGRGYTVIPDRDNDDYLYLRSDLADLPGSRFHKKKNRINYFASRHDFTIEPYSGTHQAAALQLVDRWQQVHGISESRSQAAETAATREALERAGELGLSGIVVLTEGGVAAFALGEPLNDSTVVCHFEKADPFLEGASQLVNREFSRIQPAEFTWINREQDLGEDGLRKAKITYQPVDMVRKFRVLPVRAGTGSREIAQIT